MKDGVFSLWKGQTAWKFDPERPPQYHADMSVELQSDYLVDLHGNNLIDFTGRYEFLHDDFAEACRRIGIACPALPHARKAKDRQHDYQPASFAHCITPDTL